MKGMEPILKVEGLTKTFTRPGMPPFTAVDHVSFEVGDGECLGLIGESGSGKSTVANLVTRLMDCTQGRILLDGQDITHLGSRDMKAPWRKMQMVFQTPEGSFDPRRRLGDGIGEGLRNMGLPAAQVKERVGQLLQMCGLPGEFAGRYPHQVSGGQCQRAAIARAIAVEPKLLICDEATSALDVTVQKEIMELLGALRRQMRLSVLFICHDIALVQQFCDRVLVMRGGKIVEEGLPDEVIRDPQHEYTKRLIESIL